MDLEDKKSLISVVLREAELQAEFMPKLFREFRLISILWGITGLMIGFLGGFCLASLL